MRTLFEGEGSRCSKHHTSGGGEGGHTGCVKKENKIKKVIEKLKDKCEGNYAVMLQSVKPWEEPSCIMQFCDTERDRGKPWRQTISSSHARVY